jgi:hypothetical protein
MPTNVAAVRVVATPRWVNWPQCISASMAAFTALMWLRRAKCSKPVGSSECRPRWQRSAKGQIRSFKDVGSMSALAHFADSSRTSPEVREVPTAAVSNRSKAVPYSITSSARATSVGGIIQAKCLGGDQIDDQVERDRVAQGAYRRCDRKKTMLVALPCNADQQCKLCSLRSGLASLRVSTGRELLCSDWRYRRQR